MSRPFGHDIPRFSWIGAKTFAQHGPSRRNRSGNAQEHVETNKINFVIAAEAFARIEQNPTQLLLTDGK